MPTRIVILAGLLALASATPTQAAFVVSIENRSIAQGGTVTLDVTISGPERLDLFIGEFILTSIDGAPAGGVQFGAAPPLPPLTDANYAFASDNSFAFANLPSNPASVYTTTSTNDTYLVSDATLDLLGVDVSGGRLLARLTLQAGAAPVGSRYQVAYGTNSLYLDETGASVPVTFTGGEITVTEGDISPVPAPPGLTLVTTGCLCIFGWCCSRRLRRSVRTSTPPTP